MELYHQTADELRELIYERLLSGRERYEAQFRRLFEATELQLCKIWPTKSLYSILEGVVG